MKRARARRAAAVGAALWMLAVPTAAFAQSADQPVAVTVEPAAVTVELGEQVDIAVTITNTSPDSIEGLVAHLDITSLGSAGSVDPEDWTATLSKSVGSLHSGSAATVWWAVQPIAPGDFVLYAVALRPDDHTVAVSSATTITVADRRTLNPQGILPVAIAVPAALGVVLADRWRRDRRPR
ncbi:MAG: hypothetical protein OEV40_00695 [Acidimicrobiia bacterium]|nr:hypothetical protein [Acidimicrobiia bacterium]